jgi:hypothetical protein
MNPELILRSCTEPQFRQMRQGAPKDAMAQKWLQRNGCIAQGLASETRSATRRDWKLLILCGKDCKTAGTPMAG